MYDTDSGNIKSQFHSMFDIYGLFFYPRIYGLDLLPFDTPMLPSVKLNLA